MSVTVSGVTLTEEPDLVTAQVYPGRVPVPPDHLPDHLLQQALDLASLSVQTERPQTVGERLNITEVNKLVMLEDKLHLAECLNKWLGPGRWC
jgi:hypothetical protein